MDTAHQSATAATDAAFPVMRLRQLFPALRNGFVFFDNAAGAQVPQPVLDRVQHHLVHCNAQRGGRYAMSQAVDTAIREARQAVADFLNAADPSEVSFGMNGTSFLRLISLGIGQDLGARREIVVTDSDHEANIAPWLALVQAGAVLRWWHAGEDGRLSLAELERLLSPRTRVVACAAASNATGTIHDLAGVAGRAHAAGAEVVVDAVHYGPHGPLDVQAAGIDYLACSGYKIFGPHMGFMWGRREALLRLPTFREAFIPDVPPDKIEAGTFMYENVAGMDAAIGYLSTLGPPNGDLARADQLHAAMARIQDYEAVLSRRAIAVLRRARARIYGESEETESGRRVPTFLFTLEGRSPQDVVTHLAARGIGARDGHMYAPRLMRRLGLS
ncbi:MAG: cysteine desulfurase-like protein, partial [Terriglobales bacterium]